MSKKDLSTSKKNDFFSISFFVFIIIFIPNFFLNKTFDKYLEPKFLILSLGMLLLFGYILSRIKKNIYQINLRILNNPVVIIYLLFILFSLISYIPAINKAEALNQITKSFFFFLFYIFILLFILPKNSSETIFLKTVIILSLIISIIGLYQFLNVIKESGYNINEIYKVKGNNAHKNTYSELLFITFSLSLYGLVLFKEFWKRASLLSTILNMVLIAVLMTRAVWVSVFLATSVLVMIYSFYNKVRAQLEPIRKSLMKSLILIYGIAALILFIMVQMDSGKSAVKHIKNINATDKGSTFHRLHLWNKTIELILENPVLGVGAGNWKIDIGQKGTSFSENSKWINPIRPHNDFLWIFSEIGVFGFIFFTALFFVPLILIFKKVKKTDSPENTFKYLIYIFFIVGYLGFSLFSFPRERVEHQIFLNMILALITYDLYGKKSYSIKSKDDNGLKNKIVYIGLIATVSLLFVVFISYKRIHAEIGYCKILKLQKQERYKEIFNISNDIYSLFSTLDYTGNPLLFHKAYSLDKIGGSIDEVNDIMLKGLEDNPYNLKTLNGLAYVYSKKQNYLLAELYCEKALKYSPNDMNSLITYAKLKEKTEGIDRAFSILRKIKPRKNNNDYRLFMDYVLDMKTQKILDRISDANDIDTLQKIIKEENFMYEAYVKSYKNDEEYEKILLENIINQLQIMKINITDTNFKQILSEYKIF